MDSKWIYLVVLDLCILTCCKPGNYHYPHKPDDKPPWSHGGWGSHGWDGHRWDYHDWDHDYTIQRTRTKDTTTQRTTTKDTPPTSHAQRSTELRSSTSTLPQPTIRDIDIRLGKIASAGTTSSPIVKPLVEREIPSLTEDDAGQPYSTPKFFNITLITDDKKDNLDTDTKSDTNAKLDTEEDNEDNLDNIDLTPGIKKESNKVESPPNTPEAVDTDGLENAMIDVQPANKWHVGIYDKELSKKHSHKVFIFKYKCGGSLIKANTVISAGHCFWSPVWQQLISSDFEVAAGKMYRLWEDPRDKHAQYSYVKRVTITPMHEPCRQPDLAFVTVDPAFVFDSFVKPVCINFEEALECQQLRRGNIATISTWAILDGAGACQHSEPIHWLTLPYIDVKTCTNDQIMVNRLSHRICAGDANSETQCESDSGNGLVFFEDKIPYLRGVASFIPTDSICMKYTSRSFTNLGAAKVKAKEDKIKQLFETLVFEQCEDLYKDKTDETVSQGMEESDDENNDDGYGIQSIGSQPVLGLNGTSAPSYQWHVGVYSKNWTPYMQICGGSLVKRDFVISAAHCFWHSVTGPQSSTRFAVAGGKLYRPWNDRHDTYSQHSDVSDIILPVRFRGAATSFQDDIAILRLESPFTYALGVQPACLDFGMEFDKKHLQPGTEGTVAGWGLTEENGVPSQRLNYLKLPYVDLDECFAGSDPSFYKYITSDKICAGTQVTGKALCRGDSGGGLVIFDAETPYLRGVASTAANNENLCNAYTLAAFTHIYAHRTFLRDNIPDIEKECPQTTTKPGVGDGEAVSDANKKPGKDRNSPASSGVGNGGSVRPRREVARVDTTPSYSSVPYNHFVCNCNCKSLK